MEQNIRQQDTARHNVIIEQAYEQIMKGFPARLVAYKSQIDYRELFKLMKKRKYKPDNDYSYFISWLLENENDKFKEDFNNIIKKADYIKTFVVPQYLFISVYIFLKHNETYKKNTINLLLQAFNMSAQTWARYKKEIIKISDKNG